MEYILCAAIWYKELPTPIYTVRNVDKGIVFCGHRHPHCIHQMIAMTGKYQSEVGEYIQGFLTNTNRFVDRTEAAEIAFNAKQTKELFKNLFSENLY
jgi:hypothetical protein